MERKLILVRHLKTSYNRDGKIMGGVVDSEIIDDKDSIAKMITTVKSLFDGSNVQESEVVFISSPLKRCLSTISKIKDATFPQAEIIEYEDLRETGMGDFTNKNAKDLRGEYGNIIDDWMHEPEQFTFPNGESYAHVKERVMQTLHDLNKQYLDKKVIVVCSHVDIIKMAICIVRGISFNERRSFDIPNGSVSVISLNPEGQMSIEGVNL